MHQNAMKLLNSAVVVGALGYFVDIYDLLLFGIVRVQSLKDIGVPEEELMKVGMHLLDVQMLGLLIGGIFWGVLGDKKGRLSVLFGSIVLYSVANIANAFIHTVDAYAFWRFVAGIGLAGELGVAITLVAEVMPKETRGIGTSIVAGFGILGAVFAALIGDWFSWRVAYVVGGVMGLALLILRIQMAESGMFKNATETDCSRGSLWMLFNQWDRFRRYISCILIGVPIWFVIGVLVTFSPELSKLIGVQGPISGGSAILFAYVGLSLGDISSGLLSQYMKSRKKVIALFIALTYGLIVFYVNSSGLSVVEFYGLCVALGFAVGYWAVFVTNASEQFGTNMRATVATTAPNFVRGSVVLINWGYATFRQNYSGLTSAWIVGSICTAVALLALASMREPFGKDLNFIER